MALYIGNTKVTPVALPSLETESLNVTPTTSTQVINASGNLRGYKPVTVNAVTSSIDSNIQAGNIKSGVSILGVEGTYITSSDIMIPREVSNTGVYQMPTSSSTFSLPENATDVGNYALSRAFYGCTSLTSVDLSSLTTISGNRALGYAFSGCTSLTSVDLSSLTTISGNYALYYAFYGCTGLTSLSFPSLISTAFGSYTNQFNNMLYGVTGCTVHFPSNLQSVIGSWSDVTNGFGGTSTTVLFDLPATEGELPWTQPVLSANGTLGGDSFAVQASAEYSSSYAAWKAFDGIKTGTNVWRPNGTGSTGIPVTLIMYNPDPIKISNLTFTNYANYANNAPDAGTIYGSNDNSSYTSITSFTNDVQAKSAEWNVSMSSNTNFYKYYKIEFTQWQGASTGGRNIAEIEITATEQGGGTNLTVVTDPSDAVCTLTYGGNSYEAKSANVPIGTEISYSVTHSTYGTKTGSVTMGSTDKTLTFTGTSNTSYTETSWTQPSLSANGTLGGNSFACEASSEYSTYYAWHAFDKDYGASSSTVWAVLSSGSASLPAYMIIYSPTDIKISKFTVWNRAGYTFAFTGGSVQASGNGSSWSTIVNSWSNSVTTSNTSWDITVSSSSFYKYYKIIFDTFSNGAYRPQCQEIVITATQQVPTTTYSWTVAES